MYISLCTIYVKGYEKLEIKTDSTLIEVSVARELNREVSVFATQILSLHQTELLVYFYYIL